MDVDVAIVGGGPAGCAAALALRRLGRSTTIIAAPSRRAKPTETAVPALARLLQSLGAVEALRACEPCYGISSGWGRKLPALQSSITDPLGHGWFIHRTRFDSYLRQAACDAGAIWIQEQARSVEFDPDGVFIGTSGQPVYARSVVVATGSPSWPARMTQQKPSSMDSLIVFWAHIPAPLEQRLLFVEPTDCGWWYVCPADDRGAMACFVTDLLSARALSLTQPSAWNKLFQATKLFQQFEGNPSAESVHVALTDLSALPQKHGLRWIAVGDAAAKLDPLGSSGTATALDSGQRAAAAVADALQGNPASAERYGRWITGLVDEFTKQRARHYAMETSRRVGLFWSRRFPWTTVSVKQAA